MPLPATQTVPAWYSTSQLFNIIGELVKSTPSSPQPITVTPEGSFTLDTLYNLDGSPAPNPLPTAVDIASGIAGGADPNGNLQFGASAGFKDLWSGGTYIGTVELSAADVDTVHRSGNETIAGTKTFTALPSVPVLPVNPGDVASKSYVDTYAIAGAYYKSEVQAATTAALPASTYAAGPQTLTANANGALPGQDGYAPVVGDSLLVKNEAAGANNGIYTVTALGSGAAPWVLTRRSDASTGADLAGGAAVYVLSGTTFGGTTWIQTTKTVTIGTTSQVWVQSATAIGMSLQHNRTQLTTPFFSSATSPHVMLSGSFTPLASKGRLHIDLAGYFWGLASFAAFGLLWGTAAFPLFQPASTSGGTTPKSGVTHEVLGNIGGGGNALESFGTVSKTIPFSGLSPGTTYNWSILVGVPSGSMAIPTNGLADNAGATNLLSLAATPDRRKLYIGNAQGWVTILNTDARVGPNAIGILNPHNQYGGKISMFANIWPNACQAMSVTPDGTRLLVVHGSGQGKVTVINTSTDTIIGTYTLPGTSPNAQGVACPNNTTAYVTDWQNGVAYPFNIAAGTFGAAITLGTHPGKCRRTPDGSKVYVIQKAGNTVWCINTATNTVSATITVPGSAPSLSDLAVMPDGSAVWVTDASADQKVVEITVSTQSVGVSSSAMLGGPPQSIGIDPQGLTAWVGGSSSTTDPINQLHVSDPPGAAAGTYKGQWFINVAGAAVAGGSDEIAILIDAYGFISRLDWQRGVYNEWPIGQFSCDPTSGFVNSHCHTIYEDVL